MDPDDCVSCGQSDSTIRLLLYIYVDDYSIAENIEDDIEHFLRQDVKAKPSTSLIWRYIATALAERCGCMSLSRNGQLA